MSATSPAPVAAPPAVVLDITVTIGEEAVFVAESPFATETI